MSTTTVSYGAEVTTNIVSYPSNCPNCRKPYYVSGWFGVIPPDVCRCPVDLPYVQIIPPVVRLSWQCPGCKHWKAPHVDECKCEDP